MRSCLSFAWLLVAASFAGFGCGSSEGSYVETTLTLELTLPAAGATADAGAAAGSEGPSKLEITARDGDTPVVTDLWLYTLDGAAQMTPLTGFTSTAARKSPGLMLPATIAGQPSGLTPADDGRQNGLMTNATRGTLLQGAFVSSVNGTVTVTFSAPSTAPILVVAGVEDERYAELSLRDASSHLNNASTSCRAQGVRRKNARLEPRLGS